MIRAAWLTDIHLNFVAPERVDAFMDEIIDADPDIVICTGDIGESETVVEYLQTMERWLKRPIYFVLGNHDFYRSSITEVRRQVSELCAQSGYLTWLNEAAAVSLTQDTVLVGHDSWGDGRCGEYENSSLVLTDFLFIQELLGSGKQGRRAMLERLGDEAAAHFRRVLPPALDAGCNAILATHVPPFVEASMHGERMCSGEALPYYACQAVGDVLSELMSAHPDQRLTVLCGHTHSAADVQMLPNLQVLVGEVAYEAPVIQRIIELTQG
jgi:3',5'-cyclic AMP phosphodiesterase CpdA